MSNLNGRKVSLIRLQSTTHANGIGNLGPTVDENSAKVLGAATLTATSEGVLFATKNVEVLFPWNNIISATLAPTKATVVGKIDLKSDAG